MTGEKLWGVVADAGRTRIFEWNAHGIGFVENHALATATALPPTHEVAADRPGRTHNSVGPGRHAMQAPTDPHRDLKRKSAELLATFLLARLRDGAFDRLIVVAPPIFLGDLRQRLSHQVASRVLHEFPKDMTKVPSHDLSERLEDLLKSATWK